MTQQQFLNSIEGTLNDLEGGIMTKDESIKALLETFMSALQPFVKSKEHLQLFMYRVHKMRELQKQFFAGKRNVIADSKKAESTVDNAVNKLISEFGYNMEDIAKKYEQTKLL